MSVLGEGTRPCQTISDIKISPEMPGAARSPVPEDDMTELTAKKPMCYDERACVLIRADARRKDSPPPTARSKVKGVALRRGIRACACFGFTAI